MPGCTGGRSDSEQASAGYSRSDIKLVLKPVGTTISIDTATFCIINLAAEGKDHVVKVTDLRLQEDELVGLEHRGCTIGLATGLDLWVEGLGDLFKNIGTFSGGLAY